MKKTWGSEKFSRSFFTVRLFLEHYTVMVYDSNMKLSAAHLILVLFTFTFFLFASCSARGGTPRTEQVLGTVCTINAYTDGTDALYAELFARLTQIDNEFSVNKEASELSKVNDAAGDHAVEVTDDVLFVLKTALRYAALSDGAFDPTIGPLVKLWGINTDHARVPSKQEIAMALPLVNWRNVAIDGSTVFLTQKGMALDLGGIAKGYAADEMVRILKVNNVHRAVIDLGGNIFVYGTKKDKSAWRVGIKDPDHDEGDPALVLSLDHDMTVVTSGVYERFFFQDGKRYHHILDTKTGYPAQSGLLSSTIVCGSSIQADALSTISFIWGPKKFNELLEKLDEDVKYVFISENHSVMASASLEQMLKVNSVNYAQISYFK